MCVWSTVSISCKSIEVSIPPIEVIFPTTDSYHEYHTVIIYWLPLHSKYFMQNSIEVSIPPIEDNFPTTDSYHEYQVILENAII